jgi:uncharacterized protein (DUF58 family)
MIAPTRQLYLLSLIPLIMTFALYAVPSMTWVVLAIDVALLCFALYDLLSLPGRNLIDVQRAMKSVATRGEKHELTLIVQNRTNRTLSVQMRDDFDQTFQTENNVINATLEPRSRNAFSIDLIPARRGEFTLGQAHVMVVSRAKLWKSYFRSGQTQVLRVYPALKQISKYALLARQNRMSLLGLRKTRRAGSENEFERLRDYTPDDRYRAIDWRATSRRLKLTVRDFQTTQSQRVIFAIDCGRMMVNESNGFSLFDAAIDAALTLSYVALNGHDQVGLMCFNSQVIRWIPPKAGRSHLNTLVHAVHDVEPGFVESRFDEAFLHLHRHCRKRSLVILISNVIDDRNASSIEMHTSNLVGQHLPLTVLFRDPELFKPVEHAWEAGPENLTSTNLYRAAAAADILSWREKTLTEMRHAGVLTLDVSPEDLTAPLINEYFQIKQKLLL